MIYRARGSIDRWERNNMRMFGGLKENKQRLGGRIYESLFA